MRPSVRARLGAPFKLGVKMHTNVKVPSKTPSKVYVFSPILPFRCRVVSIYLSRCTLIDLPSSLLPSHRPTHLDNPHAQLLLLCIVHQAIVFAPLLQEPVGMKPPFSLLPPSHSSSLLRPLPLPLRLLPHLLHHPSQPACHLPLHTPLSYFFSSTSSSCSSSGFLLYEPGHTCHLYIHVNLLF